MFGAILGGVIGAAGSIFGGNAAAKAQKQSAKIMAKQQEANRELLRPAIESGNLARGSLEGALGLQGRETQQGFYDNFQTDPGFQNAVDYGLDQVDSRMGSLGMRRSGNTMAALHDFGQRSMYDAYQNRLNRLSSLASGGQQTAGQLAGINTGAAGQQANMIGNAGYYQGAGYQNAGNAINSAMHNYGVLQAYQGGGGGNVPLPVRNPLR